MREGICDTSPIQYLHQIGFQYLLEEFDWPGLRSRPRKGSRRCL